MLGARITKKDIIPRHRMTQVLPSYYVQQSLGLSGGFGTPVRTASCTRSSESRVGWQVQSNKGAMDQAWPDGESRQLKGMRSK
jgi:hypothetical protein